MKKTKFISRDKEVNQVLDFIREKKSGLTYLRGRRRVGKTWLLKSLESSLKSDEKYIPFYYMGTRNADDGLEQKMFIQRWAEETGGNGLLELKESAISWHRIFQNVTTFAKEIYPKKLVLFFDEIQWMAKKNSGLISRIKEAWVDWEQAGNVKVILCGSSSRFFEKKAMAAEAVLRGLKTHASIILEEFSPEEISKFYIPNWNKSEQILTYMLLGGVPYYYSTLDTSLSFIPAINKAVFCKNSIFPEEINEILNLEFNKQGVKTAKQILSTLGYKGRTQSKIVKQADMPASTVSDQISELLDFNIIKEKQIAGKKIKSNQGKKYYLFDFFLHTYFNLLEPLEKVIKLNDDSLIFTSRVINSKDGYYIPNFSGHAFELYIESLLQKRDLKNNLLKKLDIKTVEYEIKSYESNDSEIDLIVESSPDRMARIIECKWLDSVRNINSLIDELKAKKYPHRKNYSVKHYLIIPTEFTKNHVEKAKESYIKLIGIGDLI